jgi:hypothetical protein
MTVKIGAPDPISIAYGRNFLSDWDLDENLHRLFNGTMDAIPLSRKTSPKTQA